MLDARFRRVFNQELQEYFFQLFFIVTWTTESEHFEERQSYHQFRPCLRSYLSNQYHTEMVKYGVQQITNTKTETENKAENLHKALYGIIHEAFYTFTSKTNFEWRNQK